MSDRIDNWLEAAAAAQAEWKPEKQFKAARNTAGVCYDCETAIPLERRRAALDPERCVKCQEEEERHEERLKRSDTPHWKYNYTTEDRY